MLKSKHTEAQMIGALKQIVSPGANVWSALDTKP